MDIADALALLHGIPFRADPVSLEVVLEGPRTQALLEREAGTPLSSARFWEVLVPAEERGRLFATLRQVAEDGEARSVEHRAQLTSRPAATFHTAVQRVVGPEGEVILRGVMLDVTASRAVQRQSHEVEAWLATLAECLPFDFWICDRLGRFVLQNPASRKRLGNLLGLTAEALPLPEEEKAGWTRLHARALGGERVQEEHADGEGGVGRVYSRVISPVREEPSGEVSGAVGVDLDVTDLKRAEQKLRQSLEELGRAQDTLVRREQLAALGEMAAAISHEVRNPLGIMANALQLLRRNPPERKEQGELLDILHEEVNRLDVLVRNLLDLVRPLEAAPRAQALAPVVEEALADALRATPQAERIRVIRRLPEAALEVNADGRLLNLALVNALRNALQAMPEGGDLEVALSREEGEGQVWARVEIRDSGPGIPPEVLQRIFDPFFTTRSTGSGIGLTLVKRVISEHDGEVAVHSAPGEGTRFTIRLPCLTGGP